MLTTLISSCLHIATTNKTNVFRLSKRTGGFHKSIEIDIEIMAKPKGERKKKTELVFDPKKRREFLTGFRKRKQERKQKARDELEKQVKEERKRIKQEIRDGFQEQFKKSFAPIELEGQLKEEEYDTENVTVQIVELSTDEIAKSNNWIGANKPIYEGEQSSDNGSDSDGENEDDVEEIIPGFTVTSNKPTKKSNAQDKKPDDAETENSVDETKSKKKFKKIPEDIKSKRALGQFFAKRATNTLKHSKAFQMKNRLERNKNKKKARVEKEKRIKLQNKREKHKKNSSKSTKPPKINKMGKKSKNHKK